MNIQSKANPFILDLVRYMPGKPIEETAREIGMKPEEIIKLASNENPLGPSPKAVEAMKEAVMKSHIYPDGAAFELSSAIGEKYDLPWDQVVLGTGSSEVIELLCHSFLNPDAEMIVAQYSFSMYKVMATLFGAKFTEIPAQNYTHDLESMADAINEKTRLVIICNPNNPTGTMVSPDEIETFMKRVPDHVVVVFDEAYIEFADPEIVTDTLKYVRAGRNVCVLRTFSKIQGLAGLRIGFGLTTAPIADLLHKSRAPFNVNAIAQAGALAALSDEEHVKNSVQVNSEGMEFFSKAFRELGLKYIPSHGNFILVKVGDGQKVFADMLNKGIIIRAMGGSGLPEWVRITVGPLDMNLRCLKVLKEVLGLV